MGFINTFCNSRSFENIKYLDMAQNEDELEAPALVQSEANFNSVVNKLRAELNKETCWKSALWWVLNSNNWFMCKQ